MNDAPPNHARRERPDPPRPKGPAPVAAFVLDASPPKRLDWEGVRNVDESAGAVWVHMDRSDAESQRWVRESAGLDPFVVNGLLDENTRPRIFRVGDGLLATIRGVNLNPGAEPDDMISLRIWATRRRVLSLRLAKLASVRTVMDSVEEGAGPRTSGSLVTALVCTLVDRAEPAVLALVHRLEDMEEQTIDARRHDPERGDLLDVRQQVITLNRYLSPQAVAMRNLAEIAPDWLDGDNLRDLAEATNRLTRLVEDLQATGTRAMVVQDEIANKLAERLGERTYTLTVIAGIVLPLTLLTGVFGMNVGGMPWLEDPNGFWIVCGGMVVIGLVSTVLAMRKRWL